MDDTPINADHVNAAQGPGLSPKWGVFVRGRVCSAGNVPGGGFCPGSECPTFMLLLDGHPW